MESEHYMSDGQYRHTTSQNDSGIFFGTDGSDANHSTMSQKGHHYGRQPASERKNQYPEFPPSFRPKLHTSVSVEDHLGSDDILENIQFTNSRPTYKRYLPTHTQSQQEAREWRAPYNVGSPASLSQTSHPPLRQQYLEGGHLYRKQTGSPASSDSSSCYNSANERLRSAPGSVISFPGSTFSSSTTSSLNSSRSGSKGILPRPQVSSHFTPGSGSSRHPYHPSIPEFVRKTKSDVPKNFPQYYQRSYESESPEDDSTSMPSLPIRKPNPVRPAPPPPRDGGQIKYRQKEKIERIPEEGRNRESLKMKLDMLIHVIKMFSSKTGKENDKDAANLLLALSRTAETVEVMHQSACLNMLIQIIHNVEHKDDREHHDVRLRATETLRNIVESKSETRQGKHDLCVLNVLEKIRCHCDELFSFISVHPSGQRVSPEDFDSLQASCDAVLGPIRKLYKYSNDKEKYRQSIISLGGLHAAAEVLIVNYRILAMQKKASGARHGDKRICHSSKIVTVIISILINLTCGDVNNKSTLCACQDFLKALVYHVNLQNESIIASAAQVLRNLSWRATPDIKDALLFYDSAVALMGAVDHCNEEATVQYITSALWNMSAHSLESRERITSATSSIQQLVNLLSYNSPSGTTSVVENVGGVLKNLSVVIKNERYRKRFREAGGLAKLAKHLKSKNKTVLANATGILWNLSAHHYEDQKILWDLGCIPLLDIHRTSEHKSIRENARGALRNLLAFGQNNGWCSKSDVMGYNLKTQKGLSKSLSIAASYTFNHLIQPQSQEQSSESLNSKSAPPGRSKSTGHKGSTSSLSQPKSSDRRHHHQHSFDQDEHDFGAKPKNKDRLKFIRIASAPQSSSINDDVMDTTEDERYSYKPTYGSKHSMSDHSYPDDRDYLEDHGYPEAPEHRGRIRGGPVKQDSRSGLSPYGYSYSQEMHSLSAAPLSNDPSDTTTSLSVLESKLDKFDPHQPLQGPEENYVELEADLDEEDDIDQPIRRGNIPIGTHPTAGMEKHPSQAFSLNAKHPGAANRDTKKPVGTGKLALDGTSDEAPKSKKSGKRSKV
jgi:adenomatosis polyposis coli protein